MLRSSKEISDKLNEYYIKRGVLREQELAARSCCASVSKSWPQGPAVPQ